MEHIRARRKLQAIKLRLELETSGETRFGGRSSRLQNGRRCVSYSVTRRRRGRYPRPVRRRASGEGLGGVHWLQANAHGSVPEVDRRPASKSRMSRRARRRLRTRVSTFRFVVVGDGGHG